MTNKVFYEELLPDEFTERILAHPIGYLPLGTLEWHGAHNALGADSLQSRRLFELAATLYGGIVFPPLWLGPDRIMIDANNQFLIGMDSAEQTKPARQLPGSCYWINKGLFINLVESILAQAKRAGFKCIIADGHGPSRKAWSEMVDIWEKQFDLKLLSAIRDFPLERWKTQNDHAAKNETSIMMSFRPDLVRLENLPQDRSIWPQGVHGEDPRDSDMEYGNYLLNETVKAIGLKLEELKLIQLKS